MQRRGFRWRALAVGALVVGLAAHPGRVYRGRLLNGVELH